LLDIRLRKRFDAFALDIAAQSDARVLGLFGPSGSGKSTLLNCIAGIVAADSGVVTINGTTLLDTAAPSRSLPIRRRGVGYVFQDGLLLPHLTVEENLRYGWNAHGAAPEFHRVIAVLELESLLRRRTATLSGGEARRVALGRALLSGPRLLLLDEPLTGLDWRLAGRTLAFLHSLLTAFAIPTIYVSHTMSDIMFLCDEAWLLDQGCLVNRGAPRQLLPAAGGPEIDDIYNVFEAVPDPTAPPGITAFRIGAQRLVVADARPLETSPSTTMKSLGGKSTAILSIPADDIILARVQPQGVSARNVLAGRVTHLTHTETGVLAYIDVGSEWIVSITPAAVRELELSPGAEVFAIVKATSISILGK